MCLIAVTIIGAKHFLCMVWVMIQSFKLLIGWKKTSQDFFMPVSLWPYSFYYNFCWKSSNVNGILETSYLLKLTSPISLLTTLFQHCASWLGLTLEEWDSIIIFTETCNKYSGMLGLVDYCKYFDNSRCISNAREPQGRIISRQSNINWLWSCWSCNLVSRQI